VRFNPKDLIAKLNPPGPEHIVVSRREITQAEIVSAIKLYLDREFVPAMVLASAATEVLHALRKQAYRTTSLADLEAKLSQFMPKDELAETMAFLKLPYNFFKHGDGNPDLQLHFQPGLVEVTVYHATVDFEAVFKERAPEMVAFQAWFMARHPASFPHLPEAVQQHIKDMDIAGASEAEAFAFCRDMLAKAK